jgi:hypothetical protein
MPDPTTATKEEGKKCVVLPFSDYKYHKIINNFFVKFEPIHKEFYYFLPKQFSLISHKYGFGIGDPESRSSIRKITFSGSRIPGFKKAPDTGSQIQIRNIVENEEFFFLRNCYKNAKMKKTKHMLYCKTNEFLQRNGYLNNI